MEFFVEEFLPHSRAHATERVCKRRPNTEAIQGLLLTSFQLEPGGITRIPSVQRLHVKVDSNLSASGRPANRTILISLSKLEQNFLILLLQSRQHLNLSRLMRGQWPDTKALVLAKHVFIKGRGPLNSPLAWVWDGGAGLFQSLYDFDMTTLSCRL